MSEPSQEALDLARELAEYNNPSVPRAVALIDAALAKAKADAWDEGCRCGKNEEIEDPASWRMPTNPYLTAEVRGGMNEHIETAQAMVRAAQRELGNAIIEACRGPHIPLQHRDRRPPWCPVCRRTSMGEDIPI